MKKTMALLLAGTMILSLAGCSSAASTSTASSASSEAASGETAAEAEEEAEDNAAVSPAIEDGVLSIGTNATFPPFEYIGDDGEPTGFDIALIKEIGSRIGVEVEVQDMEFDALVASIGTKIDASIAGMTITEERQEAVDFSEPYYDATQYLLLPVDSEIKTAEDLANAKMGCQLGTTGNDIAEGINADNTTAYLSFNQAVQDLLNGKVDVVIIDAAPAEAFASTNPDKLTYVDGSQFDFDVEQYGIACPKGDAALVEAINGALEEIKADGTFDKLVDEWINNYSAE